MTAAQRSTRELVASDESDEVLMQRYAAGDSAAFEQLFERYEPRAYVYFFRRTGSQQRAEDLYQDLFLRIHRARHRYDPTRSFTPWFFQIARHLLIDDRRRAFRSHEVPFAAGEPGSEQGRSEAELAAREVVERLLGDLSPEERYVVLSAKLEGLGYAEVAEHLGKSVEAVRKTASRAIGRLRSTTLDLELPAPAR